LSADKNRRAFKDRFLGGAAWTGLTQAAAQLGQFFVTAFLAHVLTPDDFGLVALCFVVTGTVTVFREVGLPQAVVQLRDLTPGHKNGAFWATMALSSVVAAAVFGGAGLISGVLGDVRVEPLLRVMSAGVVISSLGLIPAALLTREMDFKKLGFCDIGQVVANAAVSVPMALAGYGVWSLVAGFVVGDAARTTLAFALSRWRPTFRFSKGDAATLFRFGVGVTGSSIFYSIRTYVDKFIIGRFLGVAALGGYNLAFRIMCVPQQRVSWFVSRLTFAGFASIQDEDAKIARVYGKTLKLIALVAAPALAVLAVCADDFVALVYGAQWAFVVPALRIMCFAGIAYGVGTTVGPVLMAKGKPGWLFGLSVALTGLLTASVLAGLRFGLVGVAVGLLLQAGVGYGFGFFLVARLIKWKVSDFFRVFASPFAVAALAGCSAAALRGLLGMPAGPVRLAVTVAGGAVVFVAALWIWRVPELAEIKGYAVRKLRFANWAAGRDTLRDVR
jgi:O-antigen/teichoic acid export membrane protein